GWDTVVRMLWGSSGCHRSDKGLSILQVIQTVLAASFGVRSEKDRECDFTRGSAQAFVIAGIMGTVLSCSR
ncbi:MAG: DUF2970 domain-containing protein, partial [Gammaproteobacteria bacterium]